MLKRLAIMLYAILSYAVFTVSFLYGLGFIGNYLVTNTIDVGRDAGVLEAVAVDLLLLGLFALQHSVMARASFKRRFEELLPPATQRSTYVLLSSLILLLMYWQWRPIAAPVWQVEGAAGWVLVAVYWTGWLIVASSTFMIDHFDLTGLRQAFSAWRGAAPSPQNFRTPLLYKVVRHPLMLGFLLAFWATPVMTVGHLLFAMMSTAYILVGLHLEERDLVAEFGPAYRQYRRRVPMLVPRLVRRPVPLDDQPQSEGASQ